MQTPAVMFMLQAITLKRLNADIHKNTNYFRLCKASLRY